MRKILISMVFLFICGLGIYTYFTQDINYIADQEPQVLSAESKEIPALEALIVQAGKSLENRRVLLCTIRGCDVQEPPSSVSGEALSDGQVWYRYRERKNDKHTIQVLEKVDSTGSANTITEENSLVRPRGMILSTDGTKIAYFLDNIHDDSGLTELWVYDGVSGSTQIIAENLRKVDIASEVRWNASSRALWFVTEKKKKELVIIPLTGTSALPAIVRTSWNIDAEVADTDVMDISDDASLVAFAHSTFPGFSQLVVTRGGQSESSVKKTIKGNVVFIRWMQHRALFYAVQNGDNLTFWMADAAKEWPVARMKATFQSAHSTGSADIAAFIAQPRSGEDHLYVLQIATGLVKDQMVLPKLSGTVSYVVQANEAATLRDAAVSGVTVKISDSAITAFIQAHIKEVTGTKDAVAVRIVTTESTNTAYVDYREGESDTIRRMLVTVQDAIYPSWKVLGMYSISAGQWTRTGGSDGADPKNSKIYEWEDDVSQWILKKTY